MLGYYFIIASVLIGGLFFVRKNWMHYFLLILFNLLQWGLTIYECWHFNTEQLGFFTVDGIALIMLIVLSILSTTSSYHSADFLEHHHKDHTTPQRAKAIYYAG